jgi:hypothetical protein
MDQFSQDWYVEDIQMETGRRPVSRSTETGWDRGMMMPPQTAGETDPRRQAWRGSTEGKTEGWCDWALARITPQTAAIAAVLLFTL